MYPHANSTLLNRDVKVKSESGSRSYQRRSEKSRGDRGDDQYGNHLKSPIIRLTWHAKAEKAEIRQRIPGIYRGRID
jgi:hypothetical protein